MYKKTIDSIVFFSAQKTEFVLHFAGIVLFIRNKCRSSERVCFWEERHIWCNSKSTP